MNTVYAAVPGPAETDCKTIYVSPWWWIFRLHRGERNFVLRHEEAHCQGAYDSELMADEMALQAHLDNGGSAKDAISVLSKLPQTSLTRQRLSAMKSAYYRFGPDGWENSPSTDQASASRFGDILGTLLGAAPGIIDAFQNRGQQYPPGYYEQYQQRQGLSSSSIALIIGAVLLIVILILAFKK